MAVEVIEGAGLEVNPHRQPYVLVDRMAVTTNDAGDIQSAIGEWQTWPAEHAEGTFWSEIYGKEGPYLKTDAQQLYLANPAWAGLKGHFGIVPGVETALKFATHGAEDENTAVTGIAKAQLGAIIRPLAVVEFDVENVDGVLSGTVSVEGEEKKALTVTDMTTRSVDLENRVSEMHITESAAQGAAAVALSRPILEGQDKFPALTVVEGVEYGDEDVLVGDLVRAHVHMKRLRKSGGNAMVDIQRIRNGVSTDIGHIESIRFLAIDEDKIFGEA